MVAHHLAKVRVASSNLVIRSSEVDFTVSDSQESGAVAWPRGEAAACKAVHTGSNPVATSQLHAEVKVNTEFERLAQR